MEQVNGAVFGQRQVTQFQIDLGLQHGNARPVGPQPGHVARAVVNPQRQTRPALAALDRNAAGIAIHHVNVVQLRRVAARDAERAAVEVEIETVEAVAEEHAGVGRVWFLRQAVGQEAVNDVAGDAVHGRLVEAQNPAGCAGREDRAAGGRGIEAHHGRAVYGAYFAEHWRQAQDGEVGRRARADNRPQDRRAVRAAIEGQPVRLLVVDGRIARRPLAVEVILGQPRAGVDPVAGVDDVVAVPSCAGVAAIGPMEAGDEKGAVEDGIVPVLIRRALACLHRVINPTLVADHRPAVVLKAHLPPHGVAAQVHEAAAAGHVGLDALAHGPRPVLAVPADNDHIVGRQQVGDELQIVGRGIGQWIAGGLGPFDEVALPAIEVAQPVAVVGAVEADLLQLGHLGVIERPAAVGVIGLKGVDRGQEENARRARRALADEEQDLVAAAPAAWDFDGVGAARPGSGHGEGGRRRPAAAGRGLARAAVILRLHVGDRGHELPDHPLAIDGQRVRRVEAVGDVEAEAFTRSDGHLGGIAAAAGCGSSAADGIIVLAGVSPGRGDGGRLAILGRGGATGDEQQEHEQECQRYEHTTKHITTPL